jgi:hypothetical protein
MTRRHSSAPFSPHATLGPQIAAALKTSGGARMPGALDSDGFFPYFPK